MPSRTLGRGKAIAMLIEAPAGSIVLSPLLYVVLSPWLPSRVIVHVGPDGVGNGSLSRLLTGACSLAAVALIIGGATARGFLKEGHWYQTEKSIAVGIEAGGFGLIGFAVASILAIVGVAPHEVSSDSVGLGLLGFVFFFIAAACLYIAFLPRAQPETLSTHDSSL